MCYYIACKENRFTESDNMNEKKLYISTLYDYYGKLLTEKQRYAVEMYYNDDLSLSEIAETIGITRQGVRDQLKHAEDFLTECENKLGFASKITKSVREAEKIDALCENGNLQEIRNSARIIIDELS